MDENPITHPGIPEEQYHMLGPKTFWIFFLQRVHASFILLLLTIALFIVSGQSFLTTKQFVAFAPYVNDALWICAFLFVVVLAITLFICWLIYSRFKFCLGADSLKIKKGILEKEEIAIPYRQIQDVDLKRDLAFQMMGLSRITILTAGHEDRSATDDDSEGVLPALDKDLAEWLQAQLLQRANVQKVTQVAPPTAPAA